MSGSNPFLPSNLSGLFPPKSRDSATTPGRQGRSEEAQNPFRLVPNPETFGITLKPNDRGLIVSNPMHVMPGSLMIESNALDPTELRRALLYWDAIAWPTQNGISFGSGPDEAALAELGVLFRPSFRIDSSIIESGRVIEYLTRSYMECFGVLEQQSPGQWALSSVVPSVLRREQTMKEGRGILSELTRAIPLPNRDVPFAEIMEFKERHRDELLELRFMLEGMHQDWVKSEDQDNQFKLAMNRVDAAAARVIRAARASPLGFTLSTWKINFSANAATVSSLLAYKLAEMHGLDLVTSALSSLGVAAVSSVSISKSIGRTSVNADLQPFNYVASLHRENL